MKTPETVPEAAEPMVTECRCPCHYRVKGGSLMLHIAPCCQGRCSSCGAWFKSDLAGHAAKCGGTPLWSTFEIRDISKR